ncbi:Twinkle-like protein, chloroplastic/mitochondrial [Vitis vinifera]|uniref:Twinkle-like protein, chloroplastic/mitochondrial n=1 Tax=Vitis vinifera TaxID=29760 RepID=A0A438DZF5_VITVI|nr:Twinkle-like protein, chloroplastic/mitochondrial [Vitis vinifera]
METARSTWRKASRIILATDGDAPGLALAEELAPALEEKVKWPKKNEVEHFKDVNEVLMYLGPDVLKKVIENAEVYPIQGLFNFSHYFNEIDAYYHHTLGFELGVSTGWREGERGERVREVKGEKFGTVLVLGTQGEAVNAYDIDVITIRGLNVVTNFDVSSYDVHNILLSITLTIFVAAKRFKDAEHVEMTIDGQMTVDEISS